ncbi:MAG: hypothetical protein DDT24_00251 [Chloroflexi bacterium]|nr:hypothetical protein [Chloroflexota bacterium]MBT9166653.1 hypothetical protein [Chloroflexota bacterium]
MLSAIPSTRKSKPMDAFAIGHLFKILVSIFGLLPNRTVKQCIMLFWIAALNFRTGVTRS